MHTAMVRRLSVDEARGRVVTAGDDKTVRMWDLPTGRLMETVHLPDAGGYEGRGYGLSLSPDGRSAAVGGWTGWDWDGKASIYVIDLSQGTFLHRVGDLPEIICYLQYSKSGDYLAVGLCRNRGLYVYRTRDWTVALADTQYGDRIAGIDFDSTGRMAVTSYDGDIRLYAPNLVLVRRAKIAAGDQPTMVRFSPDGQSLAIGLLDVPALTILRSSDLSTAQTFAIQGSSRQRNIPGVAWSADGRSVYGIGDAGESKLNAVFRWTVGSAAAPVAFAAGRGRLTAIEALADGSLIYSAEDPVWGRLDVVGRERYAHRPPVQDFSSTCDQLRVSNEGAVWWPSADGSSFHPASGAYRTGVAAAAGSERPSSTSEKLKTEGWDAGSAPRLNGRPLKLDPFEIARCVTVDDLRGRVLMGSEWTVRMFSADGALIWAQPLSQVAWATALTPDGRFAIAALSDGTLRWYRASDGQEVVAAFLHANGEDWIAWTPEGYYTSSPEGDNFIGWHVNQGRDRPADFFRAVQFERLLYRADAVRLALTEVTPRPGLPADDSFRPAQLRSMLPPVVRIEQISPDHVSIRADGRGIAMRSWQLFVNGLPVVPANGQDVSALEQQSMTREVKLSLRRGSNDIRAEIATDVSIGLQEAVAVSMDAATPRPGRLFVLAIGVSDFIDKDVNDLEFAADDAHAVVDLAGGLKGASFSSIHTMEVSDRTIAPTRGAILDSLNFLRQAGPEDTVMLFLASHGISDAQGNYYFVPRDAAYSDAVLIDQGKAPSGSLIEWSSFYEVMRRVPGRRIVVVDTCQSADLRGTFDVTSLAKRSFTSHFALVAASKGSEESQEYRPGRHGLFTYGLLEAWTRGVDPDKSGSTSLAEMFQYASDVVTQKANRAAGTQTPQLFAPAPLAETILRRGPVAARK